MFYKLNDLNFSPQVLSKQRNEEKKFFMSKVEQAPQSKWERELACMLQKKDKSKHQGKCSVIRPSQLTGMEAYILIKSKRRRT